MCSILGWIGDVPEHHKQYLIRHAAQRGRDGYGFHLYDPEGVSTDIRGIGQIPEKDLKRIYGSATVVANFRATPTTEAESTPDILQPYGGIVHNGTIANDRDFGAFAIDSMALPAIFLDRSWNKVLANLQKIQGSYALAYFHHGELILAANYKPIYFKVYGRGFMFASTPEMLLNASSPMDPYTAMKVSVSKTTNVWTKRIPRSTNGKVIVSCSSGLDSTAVAYMLRSAGYDVSLAYFRYGCKAEGREMDRVQAISHHGGFELHTLDMPRVMKGTIVSGSYHENGVEGAEYAHDWVSGRNLLMLSILTAWAEANGYGNIAFGGNLEESGAYPDNEQEFGRRFNAILPYSVQNGVQIQLLQPLATLMKHEIVKAGEKVGVPWELTWSCYGSGETHCGSCGPCFMRRKAFERNGLIDPAP